jgi:hypothetical protein
MDRKYSICVHVNATSAVLLVGHQAEEVHAALIAPVKEHPKHSLYLASSRPGAPKERP